jgi:hypothetical protein
VYWHVRLATVVFVIPGRFSVGFYLGRIFSVVVSTAVLNALFWEPILLKNTDTRRERVCFGLIATLACISVSGCTRKQPFGGHSFWQLRANRRHQPSVAF